MSNWLAAVGWRDVVDVGLVSLLIYRVLVVFRGTRAVQMLAGVAVLIAGTVLARRLELPSLTWLFDNLWSFWVIVLVVLFQPELRRALGQVGHAAAIAFWLFVAKTQPTRMILSTPVDYTGIGSDRVLVGPRVERVDVELEAVRWVSARLPASGLHARVSVAGLPEGESVVSLSPSDVDAPPGTSVTRITPARIHVTVARTARGSARVPPKTATRSVAGFLTGPLSPVRANARIEDRRSTIVEGIGAEERMQHGESRR